MILNTTKPAKLGSKNGNAVFQLANREFFIFYKTSDKNAGTGSRLPPSNDLLGQIDFLFALSLHILQRLLRGDSAGGRSAQMLTNDVLQLCMENFWRRLPVAMVTKGRSLPITPEPSAVFLPTLPTKRDWL